MKLLPISIVSLAAVFALGCNFGKSGDKPSSTTVSSGAAVAAPKGGSCKQSKEALCTEFAENPFGASEGLCTSLLQGTYSKEACSRENLVGTCNTKSGASYYYFGNSAAPWPNDAKEDCTTLHEGTFAVATGAEETAKQKALPSADRITASCMNKDGSCEDYFGGGLGIELSKQMCEPDGKWSDGKACPTENIAASCLAKGKVTRYPTGYGKKSGLSMKDVANFCKGEGLAFTHWYPNGDQAAPAKALAASKPTGSPKAKTKK